MSSDQISELVQRINTLSSKQAAGDLKASYELLLASRQLNAALEPPSQASFITAFSGLHLTCIRLGIELRLFEKIAASSTPLTTADLASDGSADEALIRSITRVLVGKSFLGEAKTSNGANALTATPLTKHMTIPSVRAGFIFHYDSGLPLLTQALQFFRSTNFRIPQGRVPGLFQYAFNTTDEDYVYWSKQPGIMENFNTFMQGYFGGDVQPVPIDWFPFDAVCFDHFDPTRSEYSYVDVGGGKGHTLQAVVEKYGDKIQGKVLVQDLPPVIEDIEKSVVVVDVRIERMGYDYFTPQPVRGARTYSLENVLHNYNDVAAKEMLAVVKEAMIPGYSKLLIPSIIMPSEGVPLAMSGLDVMMLCTNGGKERSEGEWRELVEACGMRVVKFWHPPGPGNGVVEVEVM